MLLSYEFFGRDIQGIYFFIFASCVQLCGKKLIKHLNHFLKPNCYLIKNPFKMIVTKLIVILLQ